MLLAATATGSLFRRDRSPHKTGRDEDTRGMLSMTPPSICCLPACHNGARP